MKRDKGRFTGDSNTYRKSHGMSNTPIYRRWNTMVMRCHNPNASGYSKYGGKGITVCDRWRLFENFYADMGDPPPGMTLERLDNTLGYTPDNVIWADYSTQNKNRTWGT